MNKTLVMVQARSKKLIILGIVLMTWVAVQVSIIGLSHFLQPTYFVTGIMEAALAGWLISERKKPGKRG